MAAKHYKKLKNATLTLQGQWIRCGQSSFPVRNISRLWTGANYGSLFGSAFHIELNTGFRYVLTVPNMTFAQQVYELFLLFLASDGKDMNFLIDCTGDGSITDANAVSRRPRETVESKQPVITQYEMQLLTELNSLLSDCRSAEADDSILTGLREMIHLLESGQIPAFKAASTRLVEFGLIQNCNRLGLSQLIEEIKSNIYKTPTAGSQ